MNRSVTSWLAAAIIITIIFVTGYGLVQQDWRLSANVPLITLAETAAYQVEHGVAPSAAVGAAVDPLATHQPFVMIYGANGSVLASSGRINGAVPQLPPGVLSDVHPWQQDRFSWQMADGQRFAAVVTAIDSSNIITGYALAAQHMDYVEAKEAAAEKIAIAGWLLSLAVLTGAFLLDQHHPKRRQRRH